jgi:hypothetical protein
LPGREIGKNSGVAESETISATRRTIETWNRGDEQSIREAFTDDVHYVPSG